MLAVLDESPLRVQTMSRSKAIFDQMTKSVNKQGAEMVKMGGAVFQVVISDAGPLEGKFTLDLKNGNGSTKIGEDSKADCTITMVDRDFVAFAEGKLCGMQALRNGKCKVRGDTRLAQKFQGILQDPMFLWPHNFNDIGA